MLLKIIKNLLLVLENETQTTGVSQEVQSYFHDKSIEMARRAFKIRTQIPGNTKNKQVWLLQCQTLTLTLDIQD
jgi:hypothetical protein